jgi:hypothetical protein
VESPALSCCGHRQLNPIWMHFANGAQLDRGHGAGAAVNQTYEYANTNLCPSSDVQV